MQEENAAYYDSVYSNSKSRYKLPPEELAKYYFCWKKCADLIESDRIQLVIDIGCGPGHFPEVIKKTCIKNKNVKYIGIDFSKTAIKMAKGKFVSDKNFNFVVGDALKVDYADLVKGYGIEDILFTSFEFMEHITFDLELLSSLPKNYRYCWSVPSYKCRGHVRWFKDVEEVNKRYNKHIKMNAPIVITPFKKKWTYYIDSAIA